MSKRIRFALERVVGWVPNLFVLVLLLGAGWWGHRHHWTLPHVGSQPSHTSLTKLARSSSSKSASPQPGKGALVENLPAIEFSSAEAARNCGILTSVARRQSMNETIVASGIVGYDQTRIAQLSVRVPGVVWRVEKRLGDGVERGDTLIIVDSFDVGAAKASLLEAAVVYRLKRQTRERLEEAQNAVAVRSLREAEAAEEVARAQRFNALQRLLNLGFALRLEEIDGLSSDAIA